MRNKSDNKLYPSTSVKFLGVQLCRASLVAQLVKNPPAMQETPVQFLGQKIHCRRDRLPTPVFLGFPGGSAGKESACSSGDLGSIPGLGRSLGEGNRYPLQYSDLENSMECIVHGVALESDMTEQLSLSRVGQPFVTRQHRSKSRTVTFNFLCTED